MKYIGLSLLHEIEKKTRGEGMLGNNPGKEGKIPFFFVHDFRASGVSPAASYFF